MAGRRAWDPSRWLNRTVGLAAVLVSFWGAQGLVAQPSGNWPTQTWRRALGEGRAGIIAERDRIYTAYRQPGFPLRETIVACLNADTGATIWEFTTRTPPPQPDRGLGPGPDSTPLSLDDRIYARGTGGRVVAIDKSSGRSVWSRNLVTEHDASPEGLAGDFSPIAHNGSLIVAVGGAAEAVAAFSLESGMFLWKAGMVGRIRSAPRLIEVGNQVQLVVAGEQGMVGIDPIRGQALWRDNQAIADAPGGVTLAAFPPNILVVSSPAFGSRASELRPVDGQTRVVQTWVNPEVAVSADAPADSAHAFGMTTDGRLAEVAVATGRVTWSSAALRRARAVAADGRFLILAGDGTAALAETSRRRLTVLRQGTVPLTAPVARPTLAGTRVYMRDTRTIAAFELGSR